MLSRFEQYKDETEKYIEGRKKKERYKIFKKKKIYTVKKIN